MTQSSQQETRVSIGIDVGWSERRRTCALAIHGLTIDFGNSKTFVGTVGRRNVQVCLFKHSELLSALERLLKLKPMNVALVVDGPLGPIAPPTVNRRIDAACARG